MLQKKASEIHQRYRGERAQDCWPVSSRYKELQLLERKDENGDIIQAHVALNDFTGKLLKNIGPCLCALC